MIVLCWVFVLILPIVALCQPAEERIEDGFVSADEEGYLPEDSAFVLGKGNVQSSQRVQLLNSAAFDASSEKRVTGSHIWVRSRLGVQAGSRFRTDLLAVRRKYDPRAFDEVHVSISGRHDPTDVTFALGTFQYDWGLGLVSSAGFGAARRFSYAGSTFAPLGTGLLARPTSRESSWFYGLAACRRFQRLSATLVGSIRPWNAEVSNDYGSLTGNLQPVSSTGYSQRDRVEERLFGGSLEFATKFLRIGTFAQSGEFSFPLKGTGDRLDQLSAVASASWRNVTGTGEAARSGNKSAWQMVLSGYTGLFTGALFVFYADPEYIAPRSQSFVSYGEPITNQRTFGVRSSYTSSVHTLTGEIQSSNSPAATPTISPSKSESRAVMSWHYRVDSSLNLALRVARGIREERSSETIADRTYQNVRLLMKWRQGLEWSVRLDDRRARDLTGERPSAGSYEHIQAAKVDGRIRAGLRVSLHSVPSGVAPLLVYEPSVAGAYPLQTIVGDGRRLLGWIGVGSRSWSVFAKVGWSIASNDSMGATSIGLHVNYLSR